MMDRAQPLAWPDDSDKSAEIERLSQELVGKYGVWLAKTPALEDVTALAHDVAQVAQGQGRRRRISSVHWNCTSRLVARLLQLVRRSRLGGNRKTLVRRRASRRRSGTDSALDRARRAGQLGTARSRCRRPSTAYAMEELVKAASKAGLTADAKRGPESDRFAAGSDQVAIGPRRSTRPLTSRSTHCARTWTRRLPRQVFFWPRQTGPKGRSGR